MAARLAGRARRGWAGEHLAALWLRAHGCEILARRCRLAGVEVDILARHLGLVLIVEVKGRSEGAHVEAADLASASQRARLERAAEAASLKLGLPARVDLVEIRWRSWPPWPMLRWIRGAWMP